MGKRGCMDGMTNRCSMDSMGKRGCMDSMGNRSMDEGSCVDSVSCMMSNRCSMDSVCWSMVWQRFIWTNNSLVLHISMVLLVFIHKVINNLCPTVWKFNSVLSLDNGTLP